MCRADSDSDSGPPWRGCQSSDSNRAGTCVESEYSYTCYCDTDGLVDLHKGSLKKNILLLTFVNNRGGLERASSIKKTMA